MVDNTGPAISEQTQLAEVIHIEFYNKKNFPPGAWMREPDYCTWQACGFQCVIFRDMKLGMLRGAVGIPPSHPAYNKKFDQLIQHDWVFDIIPRGGLSLTGKLPPSFKELNTNTWWLGFECSQGEDLMPLLEMDRNNPLYMQYMANQSYKGLIFVMRETNKLAKSLSRIK